MNTKKIIAAAIAIIVVFVLSLSSARASSAVEEKILIADSVLEETRTFRYAMGVLGAVYGGYFGTAVAVASGATAPAAAAVGVSAAIVYGASMYGASTLGVEVAYQITASEIRERKAQATSAIDKGVEKGKEMIEGGINYGRSFLESLRDKI